MSRIVLATFKCAACGRDVESTNIRKLTKYCGAKCRNTVTRFNRKDTSNPDRNSRLIHDRHVDKLSYVELSVKYGMTRQRVCQILKKHGANGRIVRSEPRTNKLCLVCDRPILNRYAKYYCGGICAGRARCKDDGNRRQCSKCGKWKDRTEYYPIGTQGRLYSHCKKCHNQSVARRSRERWASGDAKFRQSQKEAHKRYYQKHKRTLTDEQKALKAAKSREYYHTHPEYRERKLAQMKVHRTIQEG